MRAFAPCSALGVLALLVSLPAQAKPQADVGAEIGFVGRSERPHVGMRVATSGGVYFGRERDRDAGLGPRLEVATLSFQDLALLPQAALLLPVDPAVIELGVGPRWTLVPEPRLGVGSRLWVGAHAFNHYGLYAPALALGLGLDLDVTPRRELSLWLSARVDAEYLAVPWIILFGWLRGGRI